jgi:hypothetical protein
MASLVLAGDTSGSITVSAPAVAGSTTQTLVNVTGTLAPIVSATAQVAPFTDNTRADFTGIPSWVKRITVMFYSASTNGSSNLQVQIGSGSFSTSGYASYVMQANTILSATSGFIATRAITSSDSLFGSLVLTLVSGNQWISSGIVSPSSTASNCVSNGAITLGGTLDRVRIVTVNGTDTFDTFSTINILYE